MNSINRDIIRLSLPTIVSNITVPLLGICDTAISGHLGSELFLSAIAVGSVMLNVVFWIFGFLRGGTTGLTANAFGGGNRKEISKVLFRSLTIAFIAGFLLIIFQIPLCKGLMAIAGAGEEIRRDVEIYFSIRIWGSPALLATMVISGWFVGMQTTFYPMLIAIIMNVINIITSYSLAFPFNYGFSGVALGTLVSNWFGLLIAAGFLAWFGRGKIIRLSFRELMHGRWIRYFSVNGNLFLRSFFIICVTMGVTAAGARLGNLTLAVNVIVMQFFQFFSFFMDGFAFSGEAIVGLRTGEKNFSMLRKSVNLLLLWALGTGIVFSMIYYFGTESIASLLTDNTAVVEGVTELLPWIVLIPLISCWAFIYDGFYVGLTDTFRMMISALIGGILFFFIIWINQNNYFSSSQINGNIVIWTAFLTYLLARGVYLAIVWPQALNRKFVRKI